MNGLSVMPCVQAGSLSGYSVYGLSGRSHRQKMIRIRRQETAGQKRRKTGSGNPSAGRAVRRDHAAGRTDVICFEETAANRSHSVSERDIKRTSAKKREEPAGSARTAHRKTSASSPVFRILILAVLFAGMIAGFQTMTGASSREKAQTYKYYTTVTLAYGEDITDIVYRYCDSSEYSTPDAYIREICEINSLPYRKGTVPELNPGTKIVIPYFDTELK